MPARRSQTHKQPHNNAHRQTSPAASGQVDTVPSQVEATAEVSSQGRPQRAAKVQAMIRKVWTKTAPKNPCKSSKTTTTSAPSETAPSTPSSKIPAARKGPRPRPRRTAVEGAESGALKDISVSGAKILAERGRSSRGLDESSDGSEVPQPLAKRHAADPGDNESEGDVIGEDEWRAEHPVSANTKSAMTHQFQESQRRSQKSATHHDVFSANDIEESDATGGSEFEPDADNTDTTDEEAEYDNEVEDEDGDEDEAAESGGEEVAEYWDLADEFDAEKYVAQREGRKRFQAAAKRACLMAEHPVWHDDVLSTDLNMAITAATNSDDDEDPAPLPTRTARPHDASGTHAGLPNNLPNNLPPSAYSITPSATAGGVLSLNAQHTHCRQVVRRAFLVIEASLMSKHAFPDAIGRSQFVSTAILECADELEMVGMGQWLRANEAALRSLSSLPNQRVSAIRGRAKYATDGYAPPYYKIVAGSCQDLVAWYFAHLTYIYPVDPMQQTVPWNRPYQHPCIAAVLRAVFFSGASSFTLSPESLSTDHSVIFQIHASLSEWRQGTHKTSPFTADAYLDVYNEHVLLLNGIKDNNVRAFHTTMHRLFVSASGINPVTVVTAATADAISHVDFAGMEVD
ncbi:uncharacterized protein BXZ73DRAFT_83416 [Epithele typhae]|uniref:uncharacterized protein n=1 Tax=Epithele typhae TaxID=378194 RepID=UPI0020082E95|nr:uncharacterized protein BXZ73DRAFT_83416 [Epithele typhae]KAH9910569.1 hypothetical protein BXZ73DRAFT_83416 [Epithele typhae]